MGDLQRLFAGVVMRPLGPGMRTRRAWTDGRRTADVAAAFIAPNDRLTSLERIEIYNRQYWFRLVDILHEDYPGLRAVVGPRKFDRLIRAYLEKYPSSSFSLRDLGAHMERFLTGAPRWTAPHRVMALEMARFEWAQTVAFDGLAKPPLTIDDLLGADPRKLRLGVQAYITLLDLHYPLDDFALALRDHEASADAANAGRTGFGRRRASRPRLPRPQRVRLAVHRHDHSIYYKRLDEPGLAILAALRDGKTLAAACTAAGPRASAEHIQHMFQAWATLGWFCSYRRHP